MSRFPLLYPALLLLVFSAETRAEPCVSGVQPGNKIGPYSFLVATGPQRGQQTCYVCETGDKPAVVVFARKLTDPDRSCATALRRRLEEAKLPHQAEFIRAGEPGGFRTKGTLYRIGARSS